MLNLQEPITKSALSHSGPFLWTLFLLMSVACATEGRPPAASTPLSIDALMARCGLPTSCDKTIPCDGDLVHVEGIVDSSNIFDKRRYPRSAYEKFTLRDGRGRSLEVWATAPDNQPVLDKLARRPKDLIRVTGRLEAFRLPLSNNCTWGIKVMINDPSDIQF